MNKRRKLGCSGYIRDYNTQLPTKTKQIHASSLANFFREFFGALFFLRISCFFGVLSGNPAGCGSLAIFLNKTLVFQMGVSLNGGKTPISHPKSWSFLVGNPWVCWGNPPFFFETPKYLVRIGVCTLHPPNHLLFGCLFSGGKNYRSSQGMTGGFWKTRENKHGKETEHFRNGRIWSNDSDLTQVSWAATR